MVSKDQIQEEEMTTDEVMEREFATPEEEVEILSEWEEFPEEAPGENIRIEDGWLIWERDGFVARLTNIEPTKWRATVELPEEIGDYVPREIDAKCSPVPKHGFVEEAEMDGYSLSSATLVISENFQPTFEVNKYIDHLIELDESSQEFQEEVGEKLAAARQNEE